MKKLFLISLIVLLQSCVYIYSNRKSYSISNSNINIEKLHPQTNFQLHNRILDFPMPLGWYYGGIGKYSLSFQPLDGSKKYSHFVLQELKIYNGAELIIQSSDTAFLSRVRSYIEGKEVSNMYYKSGYLIKIPNKSKALKLYIKFNLIRKDNKIDYFEIEKDFVLKHEKGFGWWYI